MHVALRVFAGLRHYRRTAAAVFVLACLGTLLVLVVPSISRRILDESIPQRDVPGILTWTSVAIAAIVARQGLFTARTLLNNRFELRLAHRQRIEVYQKIQRLPIRWFDSKSTGDVLSRVAADVPSMQRMVLEGIDQGLTAIVQIALVLGYLFWTAPRLAALMIVPMPVIFLIIAIYQRRSAPRATRASEAAGEVQSVLGDHLGGIRQIKGFAIERLSGMRFIAASDQLRDASMSLIRLNAWVWPGVALLTEAWMVVTIAISAYWIIQGSITIGTLTAALLLWGILYEPVGRLPPVIGTLTAGSAAARRVFEVLDADEETDLSTGERPPIRGHLRADRVRFGYEPDRAILSDVSFDVPAGTTTALVGPTGAGKTTLFHLLTRFYELDSGEIWLDNTPIHRIAKDHLRGNIGHVTQEPFLFDTTIAENLRLVRPDASDEELWNALEQAQAADFVHAMDDRLHTTTGERGSKLSGGQRQRLSIARVLLADPPILLLDEATSAVDNQTERRLQDAIDRVRDHRTTLLIAHRMSTVRKADQILVLQKGTIVQRGSHDTLMRQTGLYATLADASLRDD